MESRFGRIRAFVDTNVLIDFFAGDRVSSNSSEILFQAAQNGIVELFLTTQSFLDAAYISSHTYKLKKQHFVSGALSLMSFVNIEYIDFFDLKNALSGDMGELNDIEDAAQYAHADSLGCDVIVTSNKRFIRQRDISGGPAIMTPDEFVARMK